MVTYSDPEYRATKLIRQKKAEIPHPLNELAEWIASTWNVTVLNVIYDVPPPLRGVPRLQVILEHPEEEQRFIRGFNFDPSKQAAIAEKFAAVVNTVAHRQYKLDGLFVVFSAFSPIARAEANERIAREDIDALKDRLDNPDIWLIDRCFELVTFFFYTDAQVRENKNLNRLPLYRKLYFELLRQHDEFGYLREQDVPIAFDSKQNLDENYGSFSYYYR